MSGGRPARRCRTESLTCDGLAVDQFCVKLALSRSAAVTLLAVLSMFCIAMAVNHHRQSDEARQDGEQEARAVQELQPSPATPALLARLTLPAGFHDAACPDSIPYSSERCFARRTPLSAAERVATYTSTFAKMLRREALTAVEIAPQCKTTPRSGRRRVALVTCEAQGTLGPDRGSLTLLSTNYAQGAQRIRGFAEGVLVTVRAFGRS